MVCDRWRGELRRKPRRNRCGDGDGRANEQTLIAAILDERVELGTDIVAGQVEDRVGDELDQLWLARIGSRQPSSQMWHLLGEPRIDGEQTDHGQRVPPFPVEIREIVEPR